MACERNLYRRKATGVQCDWCCVVRGNSCRTHQHWQFHKRSQSRTAGPSQLDVRREVVKGIYILSSWTQLAHPPWKWSIILGYMSTGFLINSRLYKIDFHYMSTVICRTRWPRSASRSETVNGHTFQKSYNGYSFKVPVSGILGIMTVLSGITHSV